MKDIKVEAISGMTKLSSISETSRSANAATNDEIAATIAAKDRGNTEAHNQIVPTAQQQAKKAKVPTQDFVPTSVSPNLIPK